MINAPLSSRTQSHSPENAKNWNLLWWSSTIIIIIIIIVFIIGIIIVIIVCLAGHFHQARQNQSRTWFNSKNVTKKRKYSSLHIWKDSDSDFSSGRADGRTDGQSRQGPRLSIRIVLDLVDLVVWYKETLWWSSVFLMSPYHISKEWDGKLSRTKVFQLVFADLKICGHSPLYPINC